MCALKRLRLNAGGCMRRGGAVPKVDNNAGAVNLAADVTDRPGGRAGKRKPAEGSGSQSRAAPATVTGEPRSTVPLDHVREGGAAVTIREPGDLAAMVVRRRAGCTGSQRSGAHPAPSRHERHVRSWREE